VRGWRAFINRGFVSLIMKGRPPFFTAQMVQLPRMALRQALQPERRRRRIAVVLLAAVLSFGVAVANSAC